LYVPSTLVLFLVICFLSNPHVTTFCHVHDIVTVLSLDCLSWEHNFSTGRQNILQVEKVRYQKIFHTTHIFCRRHSRHFSCPGAKATILTEEPRQPNEQTHFLHSSSNIKTIMSTEQKTQPTVGEILDKAAKSAMRGGTAGAVAMGLNVGALMWMRTTVRVGSYCVNI